MLLERYDMDDGSSSSRLQSALCSKHQMVKVKYECAVRSDMVQRALLRAETQECRDKIGQTYCQLQHGDLYPKAVKSSCTFAGTDHVNAGKYLGCYKFNDTRPEFGHAHTQLGEINSPKKCISECFKYGFTAAGLNVGSTCVCGHIEQLNASLQIPEHNCRRIECPGDSDEKCGGPGRIVAVYNTGSGKENERHYLPYVAPENVTKTSKVPRIAFLLQVSGRGSRQIRRMLKHIYSPWHFYYVHVDSTQGYLFQEMVNIEKLLHHTAPTPNFKVKRSRFNTIWGGATCIQMILDALKDMNRMWPAPSWDYMINLSETDYPVLPLADFEAYLGTYFGLSFISRFGQEPFKKQSPFTTTFVECDGHMYKIGERTIPEGMRINGGSGWFLLERNFAMYAVFSEDEVAVIMRKILEHTLMPEEIFFQTLISNSPFCERVIHNNLRFVNWHPKIGCNCERDTVDTCGCSPMVVLHDREAEKLKPEKLKKYIQFFGRKFNSIIDMEAIESVELESGLLHNPQEITSDPAYHYYWENIFHEKFDKKQHGSVNVEFMESVSRIAFRKLNLEQCRGSCLLDGAYELTVFRQNDLSMPLLVKTKLSCRVDLEIMVEKRNLAQIQQVDGDSPQLQSLEVGTNYDLKEHKFRDHVRVVGQKPSGSMPQLRMEFRNFSSANLTTFSVMVDFVDPKGRLADTEMFPITHEHQVYRSKLDLAIFQLNVRPAGLWSATVRLTNRNHGNTTVELGKVKFGIIPNFAKDYHFTDFLTDQIYDIQDMCVSSMPDDVPALVEKCPPIKFLRFCQKTWWSSDFPDPKSDIKFGFDRKIGRLV